MTVGTIRREALRLMFASYGDDLEAHSATQLADDPRYAPYMAGMVGSINRAVLAMQGRGLLPAQCATLASPCVSDGTATFNLGGIAGLDMVLRVLVYTAAGCRACSYIWEGGTTLVVPLWVEGTYVLVYTVRYTPLQADCEDDAALPIPDALAALVPYYIKSELFAEEDAEDAAMARRYFEQGLATYLERRADNPRFAATYNWEEL